MIENTFRSRGAACSCLLATMTLAVQVFVYAPVRAQAAKSQVPIGSKIPKRQEGPETIPEARERPMLSLVAHCLQNQNARQVDWYLRNNDDISKRLPAGKKELAEFLSIDGCLQLVMHQRIVSLQVSFSNSALRSLFAEAAYVGRVKSLAELKVMPPVARTFFSTGTELISATAMGDFADCLVRTDPQGADTLIRTNPASAQETAAVRALVPSITTCVPQGQTLSFSVRNVRAFAASGLWQRYVAPNPPLLAGG